MTDCIAYGLILKSSHVPQQKELLKVTAELKTTKQVSYVYFHLWFDLSPCVFNVYVFVLYRSWN